MIDTLLFIIIGVLVGLLTGLLPAFHPNNVIAIILLNLPFFLEIFGLYNLIAFIVALSISHSFTSFISSVIFGVPEEETSLSVLPAHRLVLKGEGYKAVYLTVVGGIISILLAITFVEILLRTLAPLYHKSIKFLPFIIILVLSYFIIIQKDRLKALIITILSGILGYLVLNLYSLKSFEKLSAMFIGLFGIPILIESLYNREKLPKQKLDTKLNSLYIFPAILGFASSLIIVLFPSLSPSQAIVIMQSIFKIKDPESFLVALGALTTADAVLSLVALYSFGNPRSGSSVAVKNILENITYDQFLFILGSILVSVPLSAILTLKVSKFLIKKVEKVNYRLLNLSIILFVTIYTYIISGYCGMLILITSSALGMLASKWEINRSLLMATLMIPTALSFIKIL